MPFRFFYNPITHYGKKRFLYTCLRATYLLYSPVPSPVPIIIYKKYSYMTWMRCDTETRPHYKEAVVYQLINCCFFIITFMSEYLILKHTCSRISLKFFFFSWHRGSNYVLHHYFQVFVSYLHIITLCYFL